MAESFELDIDREAVHYDDDWLSRAQLEARIKEKVATGDFKVARLSMALEQLNETLGDIQTIELKLTPEVLATFERMADSEERPLSMVLRRALVHYIGSEDSAQRLFEMSKSPEAAPAEA